MSTVRFSTSFAPKKAISSRDTQTEPVQFHSIGTEPPKVPEKATQTDVALLAKTHSAQNVRIRTELVDTIVAELRRAQREQAILAAFERQMGVQHIVQQRHSVRQLRTVDLPEMDLTSSVALLAVRCGPGQRCALLFGSAQHDSWCTGHQGAQLLLVRRTILQHSVPLPACPSTLLFARYGELLVVGLFNGEVLLLGADSGELVWSVPLHSRAITRMRWLARELVLSVGLDGTIVRSRLEADNRLATLRRTDISFGDLPRELRKTTMASGTKVGLVDAFAADEHKLMVATESGAVLELDMERLEVRDGYAVVDALDQFEYCAQADCFLFRSTTGQLRQQGATMRGQVALLPLPRAKGEFLLADNLLFMLAESGDLFAWDLSRGELTLRQSQPEGVEAIGLDPQGNLVLVGGQQPQGAKKSRIQMTTCEVVTSQENEET